MQLQRTSGYRTGLGVQMTDVAPPKNDLYYQLLMAPTMVGRARQLSFRRRQVSGPYR